MIVLASQSPRRRELLQRAGWTLEIVPSTADESIDPLLDPEALARSIAERKADEVFRRIRPTVPLLAADTLVFYKGKALGKPDDETHARKMLEQLSGAVHEVVTGVVVVAPSGRKSRLAVKTSVRFRAMEEHEILRYIATGEPMDRAGAYAIQGIGGFMVESLEGSYTNVVGLPLGESIEMLRAMGGRP